MNFVYACMAMEVFGDSHPGTSTSGRLCVLMLLALDRVEKCFSGNVVLFYFGFFCRAVL